MLTVCAPAGTAMAPRFVEAVDPVGDGLGAISSYIPRISPPNLSFLGDLSNLTAQLFDALAPGGLLGALPAPPPRGAALWLLAAAVLLLLLRCAFLCCAARRIFKSHGQTRHLKDL